MLLLLSHFTAVRYWHALPFEICAQNLGLLYFLSVLCVQTRLYDILVASFSGGQNSVEQAVPLPN